MGGGGEGGGSHMAQARSSSAEAFWRCAGEVKRRVTQQQLYHMRSYRVPYVPAGGRAVGAVRRAEAEESRLTRG